MNNWVQHPIDPRDVYETVSAWPNLKVVLVEATYHDASWAFPLLKTLPNLYLELSRFVLTDGIVSVINLIGVERVLFGSRFPESAMSPQLYSIHHCGLDSKSLKAVCSGNTKSLLGIK
jgi:predicted TIM-barrel fold metal-dependent hydrolase